MKIPWYKSLFGFIRRLIRGLVGGWSLERKSLLFLGVALVLPIGLSFWLVLQMVANRLVMQTTRQAARDYARSEIAWRHATSSNSELIQQTVFPGGGSGRVFSSKSLEDLRKHLVENSEYVTELLMLDTQVDYQSLMNAMRPRNEAEEQLLVELEEEYRAELVQYSNLKNSMRESVENRASATENEELSATDSQPGNTAEQVESIIRPALRASQQRLERLYRDEGPYFPPAVSDEPEEQNVSSVNSTQAPAVLDRPDLAAAKLPVPDEGWYVYYHAIYFPESCLDCHYKFLKADSAEIPFRVMRVLIPYQQVQVASTDTLAWMITISMVTVAGTLFVVHWVLSRLVLMPLRHLRSVSDEISRGNTDLRANIDTGDEFNELADAFNRMLRHMTESQTELRDLNKELDLRVDQLAQANLHLYEANRLKSDFLANMTHELRTPLNSIIGFSDVLREISSLNDKQRRYASNIQNSGKLLLEMINDILDLAKVEAGKMQVTPTAFDLAQTIHGQCDMLRALVDEKNVDLRIEVSDEMPDVFQDQAKLQQILTNLLSNAIKFTPDGGMIVVRADLVTQDVFQLAVADTGVGIPESDFEVIFEKFRQSDAVLQNDGLTRQYAGTGLGLSIVKELCKLLGGEIRLTSQLGTGSTFIVLLPTHYDASAVLETQDAQANSTA